MKFFPAQFLYFVGSRASQHNLLRLLRFGLALVAMVSVYSTLFHFLMEHEGQHFSWITGFYWTLTVMSTLGFGDITFTTDMGKIFSIVVLMSGMLFLLVLLPFTFIEFFYEPWVAAQAAARAPRTLPVDARDHVVLTRHDSVTAALIDRLEQYQHRYVLIVPELDEALRLHDLGVNVVRGDLDDPESYVRAGVERAALVATTRSDVSNTSVAFLVRGAADHVPLVATADDPASVDILELAGCNHVIQLSDMMGRWLAWRTIGGDALTHVIGSFGPLLVAEACATRTPLCGKTLREHRLREKVGISAIGVWERGRFQWADPDTPITDNTILVLAGSREQLDRYDELFCIYNVAAAPVVILGGGRVGCATGRALAEREMDYRIVERSARRVQDPSRTVVGNAAELEVLKAARLMEAPAVIITTHDDDMNVYLTIYCRRLRPDIQIICRATQERTVATLHRAGADVVVSDASMGANMIMNILRGSRIVMLAEGLDLFKVRVPPGLAGRTILDSRVRETTGCSIVAYEANGTVNINPDPADVIPPDGELIVIGSVASEDQFLQLYPEA
ncbi:MAG: potassium channel protein [Deltaproteobacteria bacterium]|nr:MAG: potassium channel protein [Deltaproteobacteria bacterium]